VVGEDASPAGTPGLGTIEFAHPAPSKLGGYGEERCGGPTTAARPQEVGVRTSFTLVKVRGVVKASVRFGFDARSARV
jgi:hypothetical protein